MATKRIDFNDRLEEIRSWRADRAEEARVEIRKCAKLLNASHEIIYRVAARDEATFRAFAFDASNFTRPLEWLEAKRQKKIAQEIADAKELDIGSELDEFLAAIDSETE